MKKITSILVLALTLTLAGCSAAPSKTTSSSGGKDSKPAEIQKIIDRGTLKVGVKVDVPKYGYKDPSTGKIDGFEIAAAVQRVADPLSLPAFGLHPHFRQEPGPGEDAIGFRPFRDIEPAVAFDDADVANLGDGVADILNAGLRQLPQRRGVRHADPLDDFFDRQRKAGEHDAGVAP